MDLGYVTKLIEDALPDEKVISRGGAYPTICDQNEEFWLEDGPEPTRTLGGFVAKDMWSLLDNDGERIGMYDNDISAAEAFVVQVMTSRIKTRFKRVREDELANFHKD